MAKESLRRIDDSWFQPGLKQVLAPDMELFSNGAENRIRVVKPCSGDPYIHCLDVRMNMGQDLGK